MKNYFLYVVTNCNGMASSSHLLYCTSLQNMIDQAEVLIEEETGISQKGNNGLHTRIHCAEDMKGYGMVLDDVSFHFAVYTNLYTLRFLVDDLLFETECEGGGGFEEEQGTEDDPFSMFGYEELSYKEPELDKKAELRNIIQSLPDVVDDPETCSVYVKKINKNLAKKNAFDIQI